MSTSRRFSVVVPAHQEERVIGRCLDAFLPDLADEVEVVVVANGCTDATADVARRRAGVRVVELGEGSKHRALDAGDAVVGAFPRIYLDADVVLGASALRGLVTALDGDVPLVAAPRVHFRTEGRPWAVRAFYAAYARIPYTTEGLVGLGVYAVNRAGRARWGGFPGLTSDDLFVQRSFSPAERVVLTDHVFEVETPRTLGDLLAVRTRVAQGNEQLASSGEDAHRSSTAQTVRSLARQALARPGTLPSAVVYVLVVGASRVRARRSETTWHRDESTR